MISSQPARNIPGTSPEGPLKVLTSGTSKGLLGDPQKINDFIKKVFFRFFFLCFSHLLLSFTGKTNIQKFYMEMSTGRLRDPVPEHPGKQIMGLSGDVRGTSVIYVF